MEKDKMITIYIENKPYSVKDGETVLEACRSVGFYIPSLCNWRDHACSLASCRVCLVKIEGERRLIPSCAYMIRDGLKISISDEAAVDARRTSVELLLSNHSMDCQTCRKNGRCELLEVSKVVGARAERYNGEKTPVVFDELSPGIVRDSSKCILCGRCIKACENAQGLSILGFENRGFKTVVSPVEGRSLLDVPCIQCGQCTLVCPTGALMEKNDIPSLDRAFKEKKHIVAFVAPAVRATIGEEFGLKIGTNCTGKLATALHRLGFNKVYDLNFAADLTIMEEANEFLERLKNGVKGPLLTSCSPGWINYIELYYPEVLSHLSSCKSPQQMMGSVIKSYYAEKNGLDPKDIFTVSFIPCTAKKGECKRPEMEVDGIRDVDCALTTRELVDLIKRSGIFFDRLPDEEFNKDLIGENSGAGVIFGVTGGVMEAAVRTSYYTLTKKELPKIEFKSVRGMKGIKEASLKIENKTINLAVISGMKNAKIVLEKIKNDECKYDFVEVMGCPGGCINGGGQPIVSPSMLKNEKSDIWYTYKEKRAKVLYNEDRGKSIRQSHNNKDIQKIYSDFLDHPLSEKSEKYLHTHYNDKREKYPEV